MTACESDRRHGIQIVMLAISSFGIWIKSHIKSHRYFSSNEMDDKPGGRNVYRQVTVSDTHLRLVEIDCDAQMWAVCDGVFSCTAGWQKMGQRRAWPARWKESPVSTTPPTSATKPPFTRWAAEVSCAISCFRKHNTHNSYVKTP